MERRPDPSDRRVKRLFLTDKARPILVELRSVALSVREEALSGLDDQDQDRLIDQLRVVKQNLITANNSANQDIIAGQEVKSETGNDGT